MRLSFQKTSSSRKQKKSSTKAPLVFKPQHQVEDADDDDLSITALSVTNNSEEEEQQEEEGSTLSRRTSLNSSFASSSGSIPCILQPTVSRSSMSNSSLSSSFRKKVRFGLEQNERCKVAANTTVPASACWYDPQELIAFKKGAILQTHEIALSPVEADASYRRALTRVYQACVERADQEGNSNSKKQYSYRQTSVLNSKDQTDLTRVIGKSNSRSGLERTVMQCMKLDILKKRSSVVQATLEIQQAVPVAEMRASLLASTLEPLSRASRILAREMGLALERYHQQQQETAATIGNLEASALLKSPVRTVKPSLKSLNSLSAKLLLDSPVRSPKLKFQSSQSLSSLPSGSSNNRNTNKSGTCGLLFV